MFNTILGKLSLAFLLFFILLVSIFTVTKSVINAQQDDGLVVNLSGRQRMLTQRMTKETLIYANELKSENPVDLKGKKEKVLDTIAIFDMTHNALWKGGRAPLALSLKNTDYRDCPKAGNEDINEKMEAVNDLWLPFKKDLEDFLESGDSAILARIIEDNNPLLAQMHKAVNEMQDAAEGKVETIFNVQLGALALGIIIILFALITANSSVTKPLKKLKDFAEDISTGELSKEVEPFKIKEINGLGQSFNRMRLSMITMMELEEED